MVQDFEVTQKKKIRVLLIPSNVLANFHCLSVCHHVFVPLTYSCSGISATHTHRHPFANGLGDLLPITHRRQGFFSCFFFQCSIDVDLYMHVHDGYVDSFISQRFCSEVFIFYKMLTGAAGIRCFLNYAYVILKTGNRGPAQTAPYRTPKAPQGIFIPCRDKPKTVPNRILKLSNCLNFFPSLYL